MVLAALLLRKCKKERFSKLLFAAAGIFFYAASTAWLPQYLAKQLEKKHPPFMLAAFSDPTVPVYIHLLGSGCNYDERLPATARLGLVAQGRLAEAMRLFRSIPNSILVTSGNSMTGREPQASVARKAAMLLGADSSRVMMLQDPATTREEAAALKKKIGNKAMVIVVTDAVHMPRAYKLFSANGFNTVAAPTNFLSVEGERRTLLNWWPTLANINTMDRVLHEFFANIKNAFQ